MHAYKHHRVLASASAIAGCDVALERAENEGWPVPLTTVAGQHAMYSAGLRASVVRLFCAWLGMRRLSLDELRAALHAHPPAGANVELAAALATRIDADLLRAARHGERLAARVPRPLRHWRARYPGIERFTPPL